MPDRLQYRGGKPKSICSSLSVKLLWESLLGQFQQATDSACLLTTCMPKGAWLEIGSGRQLPAISCACFTYGVLGLWLTAPKMGSIWPCTAGHPVPFQWLFSIDYSPAIIPLMDLAGVPLHAAHFLPWCLACTLHHQEHVALTGLCNTISKHSRWWCLTLGHSGTLWG